MQHFVRAMLVAGCVLGMACATGGAARPFAQQTGGATGATGTDVGTGTGTGVDPMDESGTIGSDDTTFEPGADERTGYEEDEAGATDSDAATDDTMNGPGSIGAPEEGETDDTTTPRRRTGTESDPGTATDPDTGLDDPTGEGVGTPAPEDEDMGGRDTLPY